MSGMDSEFTWACPHCGRRVPQQTDECRCGYVRGPEQAPGVADAANRRTTWAMLGGLAMLVVAFAVWMRPSPAEHAPTQSAPIPSGSAPAAARTAAPAAPAPSAPAESSEPTSTPRPAEPAPAAAPAASAPVANGSLEDLISRALPAVVRVEAGTAFGTGFFVRGDTVLTNVHVVSRSSTVRIVRQDGSSVAGRVEVTAPDLDIAVLRVSGELSPATLPLGSGMRARAGQEVIALGTPLGLQNTVTRGIVSAVRQVGSVTLVQTDAAINPGNSGGPLLDRTGTVIGITTMGMQAAQGLSFAVAIDHAVALLEGQRQATSAPTPAAALNQAMGVAAGRSPADQARDAGAQKFEQAIMTAARQADAIDMRWRVFIRNCYEGRIAGAFDRPWYAIYDPHAMQGAVPPGCSGSFDEIRRLADDVRASVTAASEAARQADVYPGTRRDVLRRYHLDYWQR